MRRRLQILAWTLIWSGVFVSGYLAWQLFGTDILTRGLQADAQTVLEDRLDESPPPSETVDVGEGPGELPPGTPETVAFIPETTPERGDPFAFLRIPAIDLDQVVFAGVDTETLKSGPGHMEGTPVPGQPGNAVISGHRTTYGRPFFNVDRLGPGDLIEVETVAGTHVYEVRELLVVRPTDIWVTDPLPGGWLTLTTCNPKFSARERLVVRAEMVSGPNYDYIRLYEAGLLS
ncbi:MAG: sortase [Actinobacteria bacterium]|nr:sortase [Actinomycetota bacterium]